MIESNPTSTLENSSNNKQSAAENSARDKAEPASQAEQQEEATEEKSAVGNGEIRETVYLAGHPQVTSSGLVLLSCIQAEASCPPSQYLKVFMLDQTSPNANQNVKYRKIEPKPGAKADSEPTTTKQPAPQTTPPPETEPTNTTVPVKKPKITPKAKFVESNPTRRGVKSCPRCQQLIGYRAKQCKFCFPRTIKRRHIRVKTGDEGRKFPEETPEKADSMESVDDDAGFVPSMVGRYAGEAYHHHVVDMEQSKDVEVVNVVSAASPTNVNEPESDSTTTTDTSTTQESETNVESKEEVACASSASNNGSFVKVVAVIDEEKKSTGAANRSVICNDVTLHDIVVTLLKNQNQAKTVEEADSGQTKEVVVKCKAEHDDKGVDTEDKPQESDKPVTSDASSSTSPVVVAPILYHPVMLMSPTAKGKDQPGYTYRRIQPKSEEAEAEGEDDGEEEEGVLDSSHEAGEEEENPAAGDEKKMNKKMRRTSSSKGDNSRLLETNATRRGLMQCTKCFKKIGCRSKICKFCKGSLFDSSSTGIVHSPPMMDVPSALRGQNVVRLELPEDRPNTVYSLRKYKSGPDNRCFVKCVKKSKEEGDMYICDYAACSSSVENSGTLGGFSCEHVKQCIKNKTEQAVVVTIEQDGLRNFPETMQTDLQSMYKESVSAQIPLVQWVSERTFAVFDTLLSNSQDGLDNFVHVRFQKSRPLVFCSGKFCLMNTVQKGGSFCVHYHACLWGIMSDHRLRALLPVCRLAV